MKGFVASALVEVVERTEFCAIEVENCDVSYPWAEKNGMILM
jgi:hypothetical protein